MNTTSAHSLELAHHTLRILDPEISLRFYQDKLGMTLLAHRVNGGRSHYYLAYADGHAEVYDDVTLTRWQGPCFLELVHDSALVVDVRKQPDASEGYWKISIAVPDVDIARSRLVANNVAVDTPRQVADIAYLCHFSDPDGYCIELIQHDFQHNHHPESESSLYSLGTRPSFLLITYRVKEIERSLKFYRNLLGMRLLSKQVVESKGFTLYFLACTKEMPPSSDIESVDNREWLWKRPYPMVELQHIWGTEKTEEFSYRTSSESGFEGISFGVLKLEETLRRISQESNADVTCSIDQVLQLKTATVLDPDGYPIRLIGKTYKQ
jgi:lactoylglutathione lyase